ncbi:hypothetical protein HJC23_009677 [Cyclotella cryptica]|uniref:PHD-type domain-containing protein n=1 Tax=Cyclotella cryptica TaxID=29204 RepID=A0ABD3Q9X0_9STRA
MTRADEAFQTMDLSKLIFHSNGHKNYVAVAPTDSLSEVRRRILQDLDADQLPSSTNSFAFKIDGVRISRTQEKENLVVDITGRGARVELIQIALLRPVGTLPGNGESSCEEIRTLCGSAGSEQGSSAGCEGFACMDSSRSTVSSTHLFRTCTRRKSECTPGGQETVSLTSLDELSPTSTQTKLQHNLEEKAKASNYFDTNMPMKRFKTENNPVPLDDVVRDVAFSTKENARNAFCKKLQGQKGGGQNYGHRHNRMGMGKVDYRRGKVKEQRDQVVQEQNGEKPSHADLDALRPGSRVIVDCGRGDVHYKNATVVKRCDNSDKSKNMIGNIWVQHDATAVKSLIPEHKIIRISSRCGAEECDIQEGDANTSPQRNASAIEVKGHTRRDERGPSDSRKGDLRVDAVELRRTIDVVNLCASDDGDAKPAAMSSPVKDFTLLNGSRRKVYWSDKQTLAMFFERVLANPCGAECEVCAETGDVQRCRSCGRFFHAVCVDMSCHKWCLSCQQASAPQCHMCNQRGGLVLRTYAQPGSMKKWRANKVQFEQSLYGRNNFCHIICGIQAGLEVADGEPIRCFNHLRCQFVLRARLEDLMWEEKSRWTNNSFKPDAPMNWNHAAKLLHFSIDIMRTLGWAWRWADWWVCNGDNWQPCVGEDEKEEEMTDEELKRVWSTADSRYLDARRCRLCALGAALRNREYDKESGDDQQPLERALAALLRTPSLVGPLDTSEIDFFTTWLALAYRSKSVKLGFGDDKIPVAADGFCVDYDGSPKYKLGNRTLPGKV